MAYEPTVWKSGDLVTAKKLNKLEQGVANAGTENAKMFKIIRDENYYLNVSYNDLIDLIENDYVVYYPDITESDGVKTGHVYYLSELSFGTYDGYAATFVTAYNSGANSKMLFADTATEKLLDD